MARPLDEDDRDESGRGFVGRRLQRGVAAPNVAMKVLAEQMVGWKKDFLDIFQAEIRHFLDRQNAREEIRKLIEGKRLEVSIRLVDDDAPRATPRAKTLAEKPPAPRRNRLGRRNADMGTLGKAAWIGCASLLFAVFAEAAEPPGCKVSTLFEAVNTERGAEGLDLDGDGKPDGVKSVNEGSGSGMSSVRIDVRLSSLPEPIEIAHHQTFYAFTGVVPVPPELLGPSRKAAREAVPARSPTLVCDKPDPSLAWLLESTHTLTWNAGRPVFPETYVLLSTDPAVLAKSRDWMTRESDEEPPMPEAVWLWYGGWNHRRSETDAERKDFRTLATQKDVQLLATAHGVVLVDTKKNRHAWIYVQHGGQKLRMPTITGGKLTESEAVIDVRLGQVQKRGVVRVNVTTGAIADRFCDDDEWDDAKEACE